MEAGVDQSIVSTDGWINCLQIDRYIPETIVSATHSIVITILKMKYEMGKFSRRLMQDYS